jgi:hypothetical protein
MTQPINNENPMLSRLDYSPITKGDQRSSRARTDEENQIVTQRSVRKKHYLKLDEELKTKPSDEKLKLLCYTSQAYLYALTSREAHDLVLKKIMENPFSDKSMSELYESYKTDLGWEKRSFAMAIRESDKAAQALRSKDVLTSTDDVRLQFIKSIFNDKKCDLTPISFEEFQEKVSECKRKNKRLNLIKASSSGIDLV